MPRLFLHSIVEVLFLAIGSLRSVVSVPMLGCIKRTCTDLTQNQEVININHRLKGELGC